MTVYTIDRTLAVGEIYISPSTDDATDNEILIVLTTNQNTTVLPKYSTDSGDTWNDHSDGVYSVNNTTDRRTISIPSGIMRLEIANNSSSANTIDLDITTTSVSAGGVSPEDVYSAAGIGQDVVSRTDCIKAILRAESEARQITGRPLTTETSTEEYYGNNKRHLHLDNSPLISVTSLSIGGTSVTASYIDVVTEVGKITLTNSAEVSKFTLPSIESPEQEDRIVSITYVWGYSTAPYWYLRLVECIAAINILTTQTGGTYDDWTSFTVGDITASLGEPWTNINRAVQNLRTEIKEIILMFIKKAVAVY